MRKHRNYVPFVDHAEPSTNKKYSGLSWLLIFGKREKDKNDQDRLISKPENHSSFYRPPLVRGLSALLMFGRMGIKEKAGNARKCELTVNDSSYYRPPLVMLPPAAEHLSHGFVQCIIQQYGATRVTLSFQNTEEQGDESEVPALIAQMLKSYPTCIFDVTGCNSFPNQPIRSNDFRCVGTLLRREIYDEDENHSEFALYQSRGFQATQQKVASIQILAAPSSLLPRKAHMVIRRACDGAAVLKSKAPHSKGSRTFGLRFRRGRGKCASKKNCILQDEKKRTVLQLAKVDPHTFHLDYKAPLNAYQAFGFALAQWGS